MMDSLNDRVVVDAVGGLPDPVPLKRILESGANPNAKDSGRTALHLAVGYGYVEKARLLLQHGADPNAPSDPDPNDDGRFVTPLIGAVSHDGRRALVELLLGAGADPNQTDNLGMSPMMYASIFGATEIVELLLAHGADASRTTNDGSDALYFAMSRDRPELVRLLIDAGLDPTKKPQGGGLSAIDRAKKRNLIGALTIMKEKGYS
jgi:cytohesin